MLRVLSVALTFAFGAIGASGVAQAATVASFGTGSTGTIQGGTVITSAALFDTNNGAYDQSATTPTSNWVWVNDPTGHASLTYTFSFDLTGYDLNTASLAGKWGIDNVGSVSLNGNLLSDLPNLDGGNFSTLTSFGSNTPLEFNQGSNSLVFSVSNKGGPGAFRTAGTVTADLSAVPLPAGLPLMLSGFAAFGALRLRRKKAA